MVQNKLKDQTGKLMRTKDQRFSSKRPFVLAALVSPKNIKAIDNSSMLIYSEDLHEVRSCGMFCKHM